MAQDIRDDLLSMPEISQIEFYGDRSFEISVEVSEHVLRQYGLTMSEVSQAIRESSIDMPGGTIKTEGGDIRLRTEGQVYTGAEYADLVLRTYPDGTRLTLGDIANIDDGFEETQGFGRFDGEPTATLNVLASGQQNELQTADAVKSYVEERRKSLPNRGRAGSMGGSIALPERSPGHDVEEHVARRALGVPGVVVVLAYESRGLGHHWYTYHVSRRTVLDAARAPGL